MNEKGERMENLKTFVEAGREYFDRHGDLNLGYITNTVIPALQNVLQDLCLEIEKRHKIEPTNERYIDVIHYTSIGTLVSMLQQEVKNKQNATKDEQNASLRLYDSVHFNDPDEGNYFFEHLDLSKYDWLGEQKESHAYIASFIIPDSDNNEDMSDNLVFWRTYGREGEGCSLKLRIPRDRLRKVFYGPGEVNATWQNLQPVLDVLYPLVSIRKRSLKEKVQKELAKAIWKSLASLRYLYKSEAYEYERECRFVIPELDATDKDKICFEYQDQNNSPPYLTHYYEDDDLKVKKILTSGSAVTLGPSVPYRSDVSNCVKIMRDRAGLEHRLQIKTSGISYRKS